VLGVGGGQALVGGGVDLGGVDAELGGDRLDPDLGTDVGLEVELGAELGALGLAVLADHHEGGQEDRLQRHDHGEQPERERVERVGRQLVEHDPGGEPDHVDVDEQHRAGEPGDAVGELVLGAAAEPVELDELVRGVHAPPPQVARDPRMVADRALASGADRSRSALREHDAE
jgi:hypothetical protein